MKRDLTTLIVGLTLATNAGAQGPERRLAYRLDGMEAVARRENVMYRSLGGSPDIAAYGPALAYDVYTPPGAPRRRPGVVFVHGGIVAGTRGERPKDWPAYQEWGRLAAAAGLVAITFTHRLTTADNLDVAGDDVETLLRHVRSHAADYALDPERLCIAVFSAGGPLASLFLREPRPYVRCLVLYYPYLDTGHLAVRSPFRDPYPPERVAALAPYSPARWVMPNADRLAPIFLARAGRDAIPGINASIDRFMNAAIAAEISLDFYLHRTGDHGFDRPQGNDPRAAAIVEATVAFLLRHLR